MYCRAGLGLQVYLVGVLINDTLTWSDHIESDMISKKVSHSIIYLEGFLGPSHVLFSFLISHPTSFHYRNYNYYDFIWYGCTQEESRLDTLLNFGCKILVVSSQAAPWEFRIDSLILKKSEHGPVYIPGQYLSSQSSPYLTRPFSFPSTHYTTRSSTKLQLNLPQTRTSFGQRAYNFAGAVLWQTLPVHIQSMKKGFQLFCRLCKYFIYSS